MRAARTTRSPEETRELGRLVGRALPDPAIVFLEGELGAGKTCFTKGIYEGVGGRDAAEVVSPSYAIVNVYDETPRPFFHVDLYRLEKDGDLDNLEHEDFLRHDHGVTVVEWPRGAVALVRADERLRVRLAPGGSPDERGFIFEAEGPGYAAVFEALAR